MFKNMKLSMKISCGFAVLLVIAIGLGIAGRQGLKTMNAYTELTDQAMELIVTVNQCASLRRDFAIHGFTVGEGDTGNAVDKWQQAYDELTQKLQVLQGEEKLTDEQGALLKEVAGFTADYKTAFADTTVAQKAIDDSFAAWGKIGNDITGNINNALDTVIYPGKEKALQDNDLQQYATWSKIEKALNDDIIKNFLLQRILAVYFIKTEQDQQWNNYSEQIEKTKTGISRWKTMVGDYSTLLETADKLAASINEYGTTGQTFYQNVLKKRQTDKEMKVVAGGIVQNMEKLETSIAEVMHKGQASTNLMLLTFIISGVVIGVVLAVVITRSIVVPIQRIIDDLNEGAEQVASASTQVSAASQSLAEGATEQAAGLEETSSSLEEMSSMTKQNADNAQQANTLAVGISQICPGRQRSDAADESGDQRHPEKFR